MEERKREVDCVTWSFPNLWLLLRFGSMWGCASRELSHTHDFKWFSVKRTHEYVEVSKVMGSLELQERTRVYLKTPELDSHPWVILPQEPMSTWSSWKELGGGVHTHALEWYSLKRTHKDMEVLVPLPKEGRSKSFTSGTSWTCEFSWRLETYEGVAQENLWSYSHSQVILLELVDSLEGWEHVRVCLKRI
jgi:hypothetical protein